MSVVFVEILISLILVGLSFYLYNKDINTLSILTSNFQEKNSKLVSYRSMEEYINTTKNLLIENRDKLFTVQESEEFLKRLPNLVSSKGLKINFVSIGEENRFFPENNSFTYVIVHLSLTGKSDSFIQTLDYFLNQLDKDVKITNIYLSEDDKKQLNLNFNLLLPILKN